MGYRIKLGNIYEIPLPNGTNAYGRLYKEYTLAIYSQRANSFSELSNLNDYRCFVGVYKDILTDGKWKVVSNIEFDNEEDAWPPPMCIVSANGEGSLYYKGMIQKCDYDECKDLEIVAAWERHHLIDRLMGNSKWEDSFRKPMPK